MSLAFACRPAPPVSGNMTLVQGLRGLAAFWVVLFHVAAGSHIDTLLGALPAAIAVPLFGWGHYGVAIFFALSGFVIAHSLRDAQVDGRYFARFALRRSIRLDPPYWGAIVICIAFAALSARVTGQPSNVPASSIAAHAAYLQEFLRVPEINAVFWTLTYEIQFYLVLCGSMWAAHRWPSFKPFGFLALFALAIYSATGPVIVAGLFVSLWHTFFVGALAYWSLSRPTLRIALAALLAVLALPLGTGDYMFEAISAATAVVLFASGMTGALWTGLSWRWLQGLGLASYSLYLLHNPVIGATGFVVRKALGNGVVANVASLALIAAVTLIVAAAYYYAVERTAHRWSRRVSLQP